MTSHSLRIAAAIAAAIALPSAALAHHPMGGMMPTTFAQGLLSGIGHPILGPDHLAFVIGIGLLAGLAGFGPLLPALFVVAMAAGLGLHVAGLSIPAVELLVAASVLLVGIAIWRQRSTQGTWLEGGAFALAGLFHGYAFAEAVIGAEPTPIAAYIAGLAATQLVIALAAYSLGRGNLQGAARLSPAMVRVCAALIVAVGLTFMATGSGIAG